MLEDNLPNFGREREMEIDRDEFHSHLILQNVSSVHHISKDHFTMELFLSAKCEKLLQVKMYHTLQR